MIQSRHKLLLAVLAAPFLACLLRADDPAWIARSRGGMVASDCPAASRIGAAVLKAGGNAFDAAVATSLALAVARPQSTGLGGGGFLVAYVANEKRFVALDFRETAPAAATPARYAELHQARGEGPSPSVYGGNAVAVPGQVAGLAEMRKRYGTMSLKELAAPAIELAEAGFVADQAFHRACKETLKDFERWPRLKRQHARLYATLLGSGAPAAVGARVKRPFLARALHRVSEYGPTAFYDGPIAFSIVRSVRTAGGRLTPDDLRSYRVIEREPIQITYRGHEVISMSPPSSGGVCLAETLNVLDALVGDIPGGRAAWRDEKRFAPDLVCAFKHAFADRARWLGDPDFSPIPVARLTSRAYARQLADKHAVKNDDFGSTDLPDDGGTSHFCVADRFGNLVALTETINGLFGSLVVAEPYGIVLNNQMDDFLTVPGQPNMFGLEQGRANLVGPGKRPLSSMSPTIVRKAGRPVLVLGASGGPRIITSVLQVLLNVIEFEMSLEEAISRLRLHHQWQPDQVFFSEEPPQELVATLEQSGHRLSEKRKTGVVQAIRFLDDGTMVGASDPRKGGRPAGVP